MKKKRFLTEAKRKAIIADKEKAILESFAKIYNKIKRIDEGRLNESELNEFDRVFDVIFSTKPDYSYDKKERIQLSPRYHNRGVTNGTTTATLYSEELGIHFNMSITNEWEEDPDGPHLDMNLSISYEVWDENEAISEKFWEFERKELVNFNSSYLVDIYSIKNKNVINSEFISLLSDKTKEKLYNQLEALIKENEDNVNKGMEEKLYNY